MIIVRLHSYAKWQWLLKTRTLEKCTIKSIFKHQTVIRKEQNHSTLIALCDCVSFVMILTFYMHCAPFAMIYRFVCPIQIRNRLANVRLNNIHCIIPINRNSYNFFLYFDFAVYVLPYIVGHFECSFATLRFK